MDDKNVEQEKKKLRLSNTSLLIILIGVFTFVLIGSGVLLLFEPKIQSIISTKKSEKEQIVQEELADDEKESELRIAANEELVGPYEFLLHGQYKSTCATAENGIAYFNFFADGTFAGYMMDNEMAEGKYEVKVEKDQYVLNIISGKKLNKYVIDFNETGEIRLTGYKDISPGVFVLF